MIQDFQWDPNFELGPESSEIAASVWPNFLSEQSDIPDPGLTLMIDEQEFFRRYPAWGLRDAVTRKILAYMNSVLIHVDLTVTKLPDDGWQFAIAAGAQESQPNCLCLAVANVDPGAQNRGLGKLLIEHAKQAARAAGFSQMIAPVRPSHFHDSPVALFADYVELRRVDGQLHDPWLRAHEQAGAEMLNVCQRSTTVCASIAKWSEWTGEEYLSSGSYSLKRELARLRIDLETGVGVYAEPNVWFRYNLK